VDRVSSTWSTIGSRFDAAYTGSRRGPHTGASASAESLLEARGWPVSAIPAPKAAKPKAEPEPEPKATKPKAEPKPRKRATRKPKAAPKAEPGDGLVRP
jgi:hypothetical protein